MSIYQFVVKASLADGTELRNVLHYEFAGYVPDSSQLQEAVDDLDGKYKTRLQSKFSDNVTFNAYDVRRVDTADLPAAEFVATAGTWSGTNATDQLPAQLSALYVGKAPTQFPRTVRTYHFPFGQDQNDVNGTVLAGARTAVGSWGTDVLTLDVTGGLDPDRVAVKYTGDPRVVTDDNEIETGSGKSKWATMRKRRLGSGI